MKKTSQPFVSTGRLKGNIEGHFSFVVSWLWFEQEHRLNIHRRHCTIGNPPASIT